MLKVPAVFYGVITQIGSRPSHTSLLDHTKLDTHARARALGLLWMSGQFFIEAATYTTHKKQRDEYSYSQPESNP